jgi:hypothetical protein
VNVLVDALAVFRLVHLIQRDSILDTPREHLDLWLQERGLDRTAELLGCPWCLSVWCAIGVVGARRMFPRAWPPVAEALAFSAITGILSERSSASH